MSYQSPSWASGSSVKETQPQNPADYANFMRFLATRYAGKVEAYEVWNEQNIDRFWSTGVNAAEYVDLLKPAYAAIKSADPNAKVVFGGLSTNDYGFVEDAYAAGAKGHFDVMSVHPYTCNTSPEVIKRDGSGRIASATATSATARCARRWLARGDAKPIWFTEFGWSTTSGSCGVSEATQADYLTKAFKLAEQDSYVQVGLWYNFRNNWWNHDADELEARYGLMRTDFSTKPAYHAFKSYTPGSGSGAEHRPGRDAEAQDPHDGLRQERLRARELQALPPHRAAAARRSSAASPARPPGGSPYPPALQQREAQVGQEGHSPRQPDQDRQLPAQARLPVAGPLARAGRLRGRPRQRPVAVQRAQLQALAPALSSDAKPAATASRPKQREGTSPNRFTSRKLCTASVMIARADAEADGAPNGVRHLRSPVQRRRWRRPPAERRRARPTMPSSARMFRYWFCAWGGVSN